MDWRWIGDGLETLWGFETLVGLEILMGLKGSGRVGGTGVLMGLLYIDWRVCRITMKIDCYMVAGAI